MNDLIEALILNGGTLINEFAQSNLFFSGLETAFGTDYEIETAETLQAMLTDGTFLDELGMEVLPSSALNGALGAYASATNTIYLSSALEGFSLEVTTAVFLEEVGHAVDAFLNIADSAGDEGAIFSALVRGKTLSEEKLAGLRQEDDFSTIVVDGEEIIIEQATLTVDTETDENDGNFSAGDLSLREAIESIADGGTITFADGINTITLDEALGELVIDKGLTIDGDFDDNGSPDVTVQRASDATVDFRIFNINDGNDANVVTVTLDGLTISGGTVSGDGGGILNNENLTLSNSTVSGNSALFGGGIYNGYYYATANVTNSTVSGNFATGSGGGIFNYSGTANVTNSTVSGNSATNDAGGIYSGFDGIANITNSTISDNSATNGGGINSGFNGTANITNSTISDNFATGNGGGIYNNFATANVTNSILSGNSATGNGGGIYNGNYGTANVTNSTVSGNSAAINGGGIYNYDGTANVTNSTLSGNSANSGGGIYNGYYSTANITNSIVANSVGNDLSRDTGTINASYSLIENNADQINGTNTNNISGQDPLLDPAGLQDNGGPTQTIALLADSPAIDAGDNDLIPAGVDFDQRGTGFDRVVNGTVDIGAFESLPFALEVDTETDENDGLEAGDGISLRDAISAIAPGGTITFADGINTITLDEALGELVIDKGLTIDGDFDDNGNPDVTVQRASDATAEFRIFNINDGNDANVVTVTLDGLTVTGGVAGGFSVIATRGGGISNFEDLTLTNSTVSGNSSFAGGGVYNRGTSTINNSTLSGNSADNGGGGVANTGTSTITINNSILSSNSSVFGGGVVNYGTSTITINNSTLSSNSARYGGGVDNNGTSTINNSTLSGNSADKGGGVSNNGTSTINNSTLSGNSAAESGGGVSNNGTSTIDNSTLSGNSAAESGGGIDNGGTSTITNSTLSGNSANFGGGIDNGGTSTITNSTLSGNSSSQNGGGVNNYGTSTINNSTLSGNSAYNGGGVDNSGTANVTNSTISGNSATNGGGIYNRGRVFNLIQGTANITNSIVANSVGDDLSRDTGTINASYSLIENNADQINGTNTNNITGQDPLLDPAGLQDNGGSTQTIALLADSPAIDAGDNDLIPAGVDFDQRGTGFDRIVNGTVDIGAFESLSLVVDTLIDEVDGSVTDGDISLRDALSAIAPGGTITFADGINTITLDEALGELVIDKGLTIDGDLDDDGSPDVTVQRASEATAEFRIFNIDDGNDANAVTVTLDGLTVTGGVASGSVPNNRGGGIFNNREDLTLTNSTVSGNSAADSGGGIYNYYGTANVTNSTVSGNSSLLGGGVGNNGTSTINNSTLSDNSADFAGSGVFNYGTSTINNSTLSGNSDSFVGGGIYNNGTSTINNSTLSDNSADFGGGVSNNGTSTINNSTLSGNSAEYGGGIYNAGTANVTNSTVSGNSATNGGGIYNYLATANVTNSIVANSVGDDLSRNGGTINASYSLIENNADQINGTDDNNITGQDPLLDPAGLQDNGGPTQTIALLVNSPAIDAGDNDLIPAGVDFDQRGTGFARIVNGTVDIGAFESPLVVDTLIDEVDGSVTDGDISLRDALSAIAPGGTITFADGINTITLDEALGELVIDKGLTIDGDLDDDGSPDVTVERASDATAGFRIFNIDDGDNANEVTVTLDGLTITGGLATTTAPGGGISNFEDLTLTNSTVSGNSAGSGGGVDNRGTSTITNSTLSDNSAYFGGGIANSGTSTITNSTLSGNSAFFVGGGIANGGTSTINNSTLSDNSAGSGGGIDNGGTSTINNSTLSGNSAAESGGGISNAGTANITNSIVANSVGNDLSRDTGTINASYSLIENNADQINGTDDNNITGQDPLLDPAGLQDNGGVTQTIALLVDSPAIDAGDNDLIPTGVDFDQRGTGFDRIVNGTVDIGAFEVQTLSLTITDDSATEGSDIATFELTRDFSSDALDVLLNFTSFTLQTSDFSFDQGSINQAQLTVSFAAGETTQTVTVTAVDDTEDEPDGSFDLILAASNAYDISPTDNTGTINILDNDPAPPQKVSLNPTDETASEGGGSAGFEVIRSDSNGALTVEVTIGGSASSTDYNFDQGTVSGSTLTLNFANGEDILNVSVDPVDDSDNESPEFVTLALANSIDYEINQFDNSAQLTIADNDNSVTPIEGTSSQDTLTGTTGDDIITGGGGRDTITGNGGQDRFVYNSLTDASDIITDFGAAGDAEQDILDFVSLFDSLGISSTDPIDDGFVTFTEFNGSAIVNLDQDGATGNSSTPRPYLLLQNVPPSEVDDGSDFAFS